MIDTELFTCPDGSTYLDENGYKIELIEFDKFLIWASSSRGRYDQPCDTINLGIISEKTYDAELEIGFWEVGIMSQTPLSEIVLSVSHERYVLPFFDPEQLCQRQTEMHREEFLAFSLSTAHCEDRDSTFVEVDWQQEGF
jgi:hypothetical protein